MSLDWFSAFRRPPRGGEEIHQYSLLRVYTDHITLISQQDDWIWMVDAPLSFTMDLGQCFV